MFKTTLRYFLIFGLSVSLTNCGTIMNNSAPKEIATKDGLHSAEYNGVIEGVNRYWVGNALITLLFPIGTIIGFIGIYVDYNNNSNYKITDREAYNKWLQKYKEKQQKARKEFLAD